MQVSRNEMKRSILVCSNFQCQFVTYWFGVDFDDHGGTEIIFVYSRKIRARVVLVLKGRSLLGKVEIMKGQGKFY